MGNRTRKRNKSSPGQTSVNKKHKPIRFPNVQNIDNISESEGEDFYEACETGEELNTVIPPTTPPATRITMAKFSQEDLQELSSQLAPILIKDLKAQLKAEIIKELRDEFCVIVQDETKKLQDEVYSLNRQVFNLKSEMKTSRLEQDELAQYGRRMNLDISGIPGDTGKTDEDIESKILAEAKRKKIDIKSSDIDKCHRKGKPVDNYNRKVIIKFTNSKARQRLYESRKDMADGIFVQENLTPFRESLAYHARQLKREKIITKCWVAGCKVYVQLPMEQHSRVVMDMDAIQEIREKGQ